MYDPEGNIAISALIIGAIIGASIGFGGTVLADYADDGQIFNGSISAGSYIANTLVGGLIGAGLGYISGLSFSTTVPILELVNCGGSLMVDVVTTTITISGTQVIGAVGVLGATYMLSKHNPVMKNRPPVSWTTNQEGIEAMNKFGGDSKKAAEYIMNNQYPSWEKGASTEYNAIKKWLDRIIRSILRL